MSKIELARRSRRAAALFAFGAPLAAAAASGCQQTATEVPTRSLERSGQASFVCLAAPGSDPLERPMSDCKGVTAESVTDFANGPHLYSLVTQTTRGEVAVIDLTAGSSGQVVDENPSVPGANFLPVGAQPVDIVSTPLSTASFVATAEIGHPAIFAIPSSEVRPSSAPAPELSSWPACALPSTPARMILVQDPPNQDGLVRATCDGAYGDVPPAGAGGDLGAEAFGRPKLVVTLPDLGGVAVIDAQSVLDREPGSFDACPIDRFVQLTADVPATPLPPEGSGAACVQPSRGPFVSGSFTPVPSGLAFGGEHLYVGDLGAPVVHDLTMPTPCEPTEIEPLVATSASDPSRVVKTSRVAVTDAPTSALQRFVYAIDVEDGSTMVFDVSPGAPRTPLVRKHPEWNPFVPPDRIKFSSPPRDILLLQRDMPAASPVTGVAPAGTLCNPDPNAKTCTSGSATCDIGTLYRTALPNYDSGAGPKVLRGTFAFLALESGRLAVIDVDDFDAPCRVPSIPAILYGCDKNDETDGKLVSSLETSCNVVLPHAPRDATYLVSAPEGSNADVHETGLQGYPVLTDSQSGNTLDVGGNFPEMLAPPPPDGFPQGQEPDQDKYGLLVAGTRKLINLEPEKGPVGSIVDNGVKQTLVMNTEDPRVHIFNEQWTVTFEGALPRLAHQLGTLTPIAGGTGQATATFKDPDARFCSAGVQSETALAEALIAAGQDPGTAAQGADFVQIASTIPPEADPYWNAPKGTCDFQTCNTTFGSNETLAPTRELRIVEAFQDHLDVVPSTPGVTSDEIHCCFPTVLDFNVRAANQWVVVGAVSGFLHHVIADPETGRCRPSCDPALSRLNGRAVENEPFINPMFRFVIASGKEATQRGFQFTFSTENAFPTLTIGLANSDNPTDVNPQSLALVPATGEIAVPDGSLQGLVLVSPDTVAVSRQIF